MSELERRHAELVAATIRMARDLAAMREALRAVAQRIRTDGWVHDHDEVAAQVRAALGGTE